MMGLFEGILFSIICCSILLRNSSLWHPPLSNKQDSSFWVYNILSGILLFNISANQNSVSPACALTQFIHPDFCVIQDTISGLKPNTLVEYSP